LTDSIPLQPLPLATRHWRNSERFNRSLCGSANRWCAQSARPVFEFRRCWIRANIK